MREQYGLASTIPFIAQTRYYHHTHWLNQTKKKSFCNILIDALSYIDWIIVGIVVVVVGAHVVDRALQLGKYHNGTTLFPSKNQGYSA